MGHKERKPSSQPAIPRLPAPTEGGELFQSEPSAAEREETSHLAIKQEFEHALTAIRLGNHTKALRLIKEACQRHEKYALVHRCQATICVNVAGIIDDQNAKQRFMKSGIDSARRACSLSPNSVEFARFHANLLYEAAHEGREYKEVVQECERALAIENPVDPAKESFQEEEKIPTVEARIASVQQELRSLIQKAKTAIRRPQEDPTELNFVQTKRPNEINKASKTPGGRKEETEVRVAAARLLQQKADSQVEFNSGGGGGSSNKSSDRKEDRSSQRNDQETNNEFPENSSYTERSSDDGTTTLSSSQRFQSMKSSQDLVNSGIRHEEVLSIEQQVRRKGNLIGNTKVTEAKHEVLPSGKEYVAIGISPAGALEHNHDDTLGEDDNEEIFQADLEQALRQSLDNFQPHQKLPLASKQLRLWVENSTSSLVEVMKDNDSLDAKAVDDVAEVVGDEADETEVVGNEADEAEVVGDEVDEAEVVGDEADEAEVVGDEADEVAEVVDASPQEWQSSEESAEEFEAAEAEVAVAEINEGVVEDFAALEDPGKVIMVGWDGEEQILVEEEDYDEEEALEIIEEVRANVAYARAKGEFVKNAILQRKVEMATLLCGSEVSHSYLMASGEAYFAALEAISRAEEALARVEPYEPGDRYARTIARDAVHSANVALRQNEKSSFYADKVKKKR